MTLLTAWLLFPLIALALALGLGLATSQLTDRSIPGCLLPPLGLATLIVLVGPLYAVDAGQGVTVGLPLLVAAYGLLSIWHAKRPGLPSVAPIAAALAALGLSAAPTLLSGKATFAGYNVLNDTAVHFVLIDHLLQHGSQLVNLPPSSYSATIDGYLSTAYPLGAHEALATLKSLIAVDVASLYQPFLSVVMAFTALSATYLLSTAGIDRTIAAGGGLAASVAFLPFSYAMQGSLKEITIISLLMCAAALALHIVESTRPLRAAIALAIPASAALATYSVAALPWLAPLLVLAVAASRAGPARLSLRRLIPVCVMLLLAVAVLAIPTLIRVPEFLHSSSGVLTSTTELGSLFAPVRKIEIFGVWLNGDYRRHPDQPLTYIFVALTALLSLIGAVSFVRKRKIGPFLYLIPAVVAYLLISRSGSPWVVAKTFTALTPAVVLLATGGIAALLSKWRLTALVIAAFALGGIVLSDLYVYSGVSNAPLAKFDEQKEIDRRFAGQGPTLVNEPEEYAKHFLRHVDPVNPYEAWAPQPARFRDIKRRLFGGYYDLDRFQSKYVQSFPLLLIRKSPTTSRPPANYRQVFSGTYYSLWKRGSRPMPDDFMPLGSRYQPGAPVSCKKLRRIARKAKYGRHAILAPLVERNYVIPVPFANRSAGWIRNDSFPRAIMPHRGARLEFFLRARAGTYRVWVEGSFGRGQTVSIDGEEIGTTSLIQGRRQYSYVGNVHLRGEEKLSIALVSDSSLLAPGSLYREAVSVVVLEPAKEASIEPVKPSRYRALCGRRIDWIELVSAATYRSG